MLRGVAAVAIGVSDALRSGDAASLIAPAMRGEAGARATAGRSVQPNCYIFLPGTPVDGALTAAIGLAGLTANMTQPPQRPGMR
jgi:hypothetical protein